eukprot:423883_1
MDPQLCNLLRQIMHSYTDTMNEMCGVYNKRINDLMAQKQLCQYQINSMFHQHFQDVINSINKSKEEDKSNYPPQQQQIQNADQYKLNNNINTKHNKVGINLLLEAHQQLLTHQNTENTNNEKGEKKQATNPIRVELTNSKNNEIINHSDDGVEFIATNEENNKRNKKIKNSRQFICSFCKKSCKSKAGLKSHVRKTHKNKRHKKQGVRKSIFKPIKMLKKDRNINTHSDSDSDFILSESEAIEILRDGSRSRSRGRKGTKSKKILGDTDYVSDDTMEKVKEKIETMNTKNIKCPICHKQIATKAGLKYHLIVHSKKRPWICPWCNQGYKRDCSLKLHQKKHCKFRHKKNRK